MAESRTVRIGHLYPDSLNLYGDRGNVAALRMRALWRGIAAEIVPIGVGEPFDPATVDLVFGGGDQDTGQRRVAADLAGAKGESLRDAVLAGLPALFVCGAYQLAGTRYVDADGIALPGIGIFDAETIHPGAGAARCIGNVVAEWEGVRIVGFENHGGRTRLGPAVAPFARVVLGFGNDGEGRFEGARVANAIGTYLHGPLLPKNPAVADWLLARALERRFGDGTLAALDDAVEDAARAAAPRTNRAS